jgi:adenylate cyclase
MKTTLDTYPVKEGVRNSFRRNDGKFDYLRFFDRIESHLQDTVSIPLLDELVHDGFFYGGLYIVEFDPDSLWHETSLTIAALALKEGQKVEYHVFEHFPREAREVLSGLLEDTRFEAEGILSIVDSYTQTMEYEEDKKSKSEETFRVAKTRSKPLDIVKSAENWAKEAKAGYTNKDKRWLHIDDNTGIFLRYNDEKIVIDKWRTGILPYSVRARETPHLLAFPKGGASDWFFSQFESFCDGIIELETREESGRIENFVRIRLLRGKAFDSSWHRLVLSSNGKVTLATVGSEEKRRLAAIMFTDIVGYTSLAQSDEAQALELLERHNSLLRPFFPKYSGREIKTIGDSFLVEFESALDAVLCSIEIQKFLHDYNSSASSELRKVRLRIGIHVGDVVHKTGDIFGDAVNIASRIEPLARPGGICVSEQVFAQVHNKTSYSFQELAHQDLKHIKFQINVYSIVLPWSREMGSGEFNPLEERNGVL